MFLSRELTMIESKKMDLSKLLRPHLERSSNERSNIKEHLLAHKFNKIESHAGDFLLDKKYALNLDEVI